jgi:ABC-type transporter Mla subunit MlaD
VPPVNADPEKLQQLAKTLSSSADQLQQIARSLARAVDGSVGQDADMQRFQQDFKQALKTLTRFSETMKSQYAPALQKKAAALEQYLRR